MPKKAKKSKPEHEDKQLAAYTLARQKKVEQLLMAGHTMTYIMALKKEDGKPLGSYRVLAKDYDAIRSRWLEMDPTWFHRASLSRIEAANRLKAQLIRLNRSLLNVMAEIPEGKNALDVARTTTYIESLLTQVITRLYEIESDFDPEQYVDKKVSEQIHDKIEKAKATIGR